MWGETSATVCEDGCCCWLADRACTCEDGPGCSLGCWAGMLSFSCWDVDEELLSAAVVDPMGGTAATATFAELVAGM